VGATVGEREGRLGLRDARVGSNVGAGVGLLARTVGCAVGEVGPIVGNKFRQ
jgi:hypothetical protein